MKDALIVAALSLAPRRTGARGLGWFARTPASRWVTRAFVRAYGVDLAEATGEMADYRTLEALFTRELRPGVRPIEADPSAIVSPVDGRCAYVGTTTNGKIDVVSGKPLDVAQVLGRELHGEVDVVVLYLSPKDYHRVHVPREGLAWRWSYVPGTLWPVFPAAVRRVSNLFARNERCVVSVETSGGPLEIVLVGAFGVGRITLEVADVVSNSGGAARAEALEPGIPLERGALLGTFHLGSTVILVAPPARWVWTVRPGEAVRLGTAIGRLAGQ